MNALKKVLCRSGVKDTDRTTAMEDHIGINSEARVGRAIWQGWSEMMRRGLI